MIEHPEYWELPLQGYMVTRCILDYSFSLNLEQGKAIINISSIFTYSTDQATYNFDPEKDITEIGPALSVFRKLVAQAFAYKNGDLDIRFTDKSRIFVKADPEYEAWGVAGKDNLRLISIPGGDLAVWLPIRHKETEPKHISVAEANVMPRHLDEILSDIRQATPIAVGDRLTPSMILTCLALPGQSWNRAELESYLNITLPQEMIDVWDKANHLRLFEDTNLDQWGTIIWTPETVAALQEEVKQWQRDEFWPTDVIIGEFCGDSELILLRCDPHLFDFGYIVIVKPIEQRRQWPVAAFSIMQFLENLLRTDGDKYWEQRT